VSLSFSIVNSAVAARKKSRRYPCLGDGVGLRMCIFTIRDCYKSYLNLCNSLALLFVIFDNNTCAVQMSLTGFDKDFKPHN